jgi:hypothetical protein
MSILKNEEKDSIKSSVVNHLLHCNDEVDTDKLFTIINKYIPNDEEKWFKKGYSSKTSTKILVTTGCGNTIEGGADIWTNHFIQNVWKELPRRKSWKLLIDSKRPSNFDPSSLPEDLEWHFHYDDPTITEDLLSECSEIHYLHSHYHKREHIWKWEWKFKTIFVHAYPSEMEEVLKKTPELKRLQFNTKVDSFFYKEFLQSFKKRIWIGNNSSQISDDFPNYTYSIPNFYEFKHNLELDNKHIDGGKLAFASRGETRKCMHWMHGHKGYILSSRYDYQNLKDTTTYTFPNIKFYQWNPTIHHTFMKKDFGIFHGAYFKEPFGYSIFQAVDYGKLPIIHTDWAKDIDYKYRASNKNEFDKCVKKILFDSHEERYSEFAKLKTYMLGFGDVTKWKNKVIKIIK